MNKRKQVWILYEVHQDGAYPIYAYDSEERAYEMKEHYELKYEELSYEVENVSLVEEHEFTEGGDENGK